MIECLHGLRRCLYLGAVGVLFVAVGSAGAQEAEAVAEASASSETAAEEAGETAEGPQEVFDRAQEAYNDRDWPAFVECVSPGRRDELIGQFAVTLANLAQQPEADARIVDLVARHVPKDLDPMDLMLSSDDPQAELVRLARRMRDGEGFFAESMAVLLEVQFEEDAEQIKLLGMSDLVINEDGTEAVGKVTTQTPDEPREDTWTFEKHEGAWYLSMK